ncbi:biotin transporter BioY [Pseudochelatococcus contaminans]|uniref:Biotin transporter n=1 Tax=Pseudochelatococcus contaminans TaxID=1538103 RepID=A0A7W5Z300_9HYPH|nr:biotin transporter BioY [Pseudochelatococcus contaminans]MBB3809170.1 biotin transport system substrate-specific component [Pseudochelatococcus contaminans]
MSHFLTLSSASRRPALRTLAFAVAGAALIALSARIQVPFWPVPMTLHTLAVMALAVGAGPRIATAAFVAYLAAGAVGLPVFSGSPERGIGLAYMVGPTGGYLAGYLAASWITGTLAQGGGTGWGRTLRQVAAMLAGLAVIYAAGLAWLAVYVPADNLIALGFAPFIAGDLVKIAVVAIGAHGVQAYLASSAAKQAGRGE